MPKAWATGLVARSWEALLGLVGFQRMATRETPGTTSLRRSNRFALSSGESWLRPVMLPPGRDRLAANPIATVSSGLNHRRAHCNDDVRVQADQLVHDLRDSIGPFLHRSKLKDEVLSLHVA